MDGNLNNQFINGTNISGQSLLQQAIQEALSRLNKLEQDLDAQSHQIINLGSGTASSHATNLGQVQFMISQAEIQPEQLPSLNGINNTVPLDGNLDLQGSYQLLINNQTLGTGFQAVNRNYITSNNTAERIITDSDIATGVQEAKDYALAQDALLQTDLEQYVDNEIAALTTYVDNQDAILQQNINTITGRSLDQIATANPTQADISMGGFKITNIGAPTQPNDVTSKQYVNDEDQAILSTANSNAQGYANTAYDDAEDYTRGRFDQLRLNEITIDPNIDNVGLNMDLTKIGQLALPTLPNDAANKNYVDNEATVRANNALNQANQYTDDEIFGLQQQITANDQELAGIQTELNGIDTSISNLQNDVAGIQSQVDDQRNKIRSPNDLNSIVCDNTVGITVNMEVGKKMLVGGQLDMNVNKIINCVDPTANQDVATRNYVENRVATRFLNPANQNLVMSGFSITGLASPLSPSNATNKSYVDAQVATRITQTQGDARYYLNTTRLDQITAPTASLSMNSQRIINCLDPVNAQDVATRAYVLANSGGGVVPNPTYNQTVEVPNGSTNYTISHNLGITIQQAQISIMYQIKTAVAGLVIGQYVNAINNDSDRSNNGQGSGVIFFDNAGSTSAFTMRTNTTCAFYTTNVTGGSTILDVPWVNVRILVYVTQQASPQILQANSINTSQLVVNSNLDFATGGFKVQGSAPINPSDYVTLAYGNANYSGGGGLPSNSTLNSIATTNATSANVSMNNFKLTGLSAGSANGDSVRYEQLNRIFSPSTLNSVETSDSQIRVRKSGRTDYLVIATGINQCDIDFDTYNVYCTGQIMQSLTSSQNRFTRKLKLSSSGTAVSNGFYLDGSLNTNPSAAYMRVVGNVSTDICLEVNTGKILHSGIYENNAGIIATFPSDAIYVQGSSSTIVSDVRTALIQSHTNQAGTYGLFSQNWLLAPQFEIYVPSSSRQFKKNIRAVDTSGLLDINFRRFYYDAEAGQQRGLHLDDSRPQYGIIIEELPLECQRYVIDKENGIQSVKLTELKDDLIQALIEKVREQDVVIQQLQQQQIKQDKFLQQIAVILNIPY